MFFVPIFAVQVLHTSTDTGFYLLSALNAASAAGRIGSSLLAPQFGASRILFVAVVASAALIFGWVGVHDLNGFIVFCVLFGLVSGVLISASPVVVSHPVISPSPAVMGTRLGMQWFCGAVGILLGAPIAGAIEGSHGSAGAYRNLQLFSGAIMAGSLLFLLVPVTYILRYERAQAQK
jgi:MFS family permease